jgi:hypothetical protein
MYNVAIYDPVEIPQVSLSLFEQLVCRSSKARKRYYKKLMALGETKY